MLSGVDQAPQLVAHPMELVEAFFVRGKTIAKKALSNGQIRVI